MKRIVKKSGSYHHGDLRRVLLETSIKVIEKDGLGALTLRTLAQRAGVSSGAPYHHFESREQLLAAIAQEGLVLLVQEMTSARDASGAGALARLEGVGRGYIRFALSHRGYFRVMFRPELREFMEASGLKEGLELLREAIARCQEEGVVPAGDADAFAVLAWSAAHGASHLWIEGPLKADGLVDDEDMLVEKVLGTLTRVLSAAGPGRKP